MIWNKRSPKYKRPSAQASHRKKTLLSRLGWRRAKNTHRLATASSAAALEDELKIARPRPAAPPAPEASSVPEYPEPAAQAEAWSSLDPDDPSGLAQSPTALPAGGQTISLSKSPKLIPEDLPLPAFHPVEAAEAEPRSQAEAAAAQIQAETSPDSSSSAEPLNASAEAPAAGSPQPEAASDRIRPESELWKKFNPAAAKKAELTRRFRWALMACLSAVAVTGLIFFISYLSRQSEPPAKVARIAATNLPKVAPLSPGLYELWAEAQESSYGGELRLETGSTLGQALETLGVGMGALGRSLVETLTSEGGVDVVRPGALIRVYWRDREKKMLKHLEYHPSSGGAPFIVRPRADGSLWRYSLASQPLSVSQAGQAVVTNSLWEAGSKAGLEANIILSLADVMASEIDFLSDIKKGDEFQVLYRTEFRDGRPTGAPVLEMLRLVNRGREYEYYHYVDKNGKAGYYDVNFRSSQKTFFVSPLQYKRISSGFTMRRLHPIHKVVRPHQGVDYAAPSGTPVSSVADGTVIFCGWNGGYGRLVTIKHDETYTTMYAHLSRFGAGIKKGVKVKQGDLIGYVGASGTATGPHLDFRLKKNGAFIDPVPELAKQEGKPLADEDKVEFAKVVTAARNRLTRHLAQGSPTAEL